jgi:hypothetical protein
VSSQADPRLDELCDLAVAAAGRKGHEVREWEDDSASDVHARRTTCRRCGRSLYVRLGTGMTGMAGTALTERCD